VLHFVAFLGFMVWLGGVFEARFAPLVVLGLSAYGLLIELLQSLTVTRHAEGLDLVADISGVLLGWLLSVAGLSRWCMKLESWFPGRHPRAGRP
jgi:VanZ family protein